MTRQGIAVNNMKEDLKRNIFMTARYYEEALDKNLTNQARELALQLANYYEGLSEGINDTLYQIQMIDHKEFLQNIQRIGDCLSNGLLKRL